MASSKIRVLIVNPNTSQHMTDALRPVVESLGYQDVIYSYFTSPTPGVPSINSPDDAEESARVCLPSLIKQLLHHDVFLIACYSKHPLVPQLQSEIDKLRLDGPFQKYVTGIFEASVKVCLANTYGKPSAGKEVASEDAKDKDHGEMGKVTSTFGIVSTGKVWEKALRDAVDELYDANTAARFLGCETTGMNASELHDLPPEQVQQKMKEATQNLLRKGTEKGVKVVAIALGCAGMVGLEDTVRAGCIAEYGSDKNSEVLIVDGVLAGVQELVALKRTRV